MFTILLLFALQGDIVQIPLKDISAFGMPGAQKLAEDVETPEGAIVADIRRALRSTPPDKRVKKGFAVRGTGIDALREARSVLTEDKEPPKIYDGDQASIVFFAYASSDYVHIDDVRRRSDGVVINFQLVTQPDRVLTPHFAIIPLGKVTAGKFSVRIVQSPPSEAMLKAGLRPLPEEEVRRFVCDTFNFKIWN